MLEAIDVGYRLIDTASLYFNEEAIGEAVEEAINKGKVKREELFITTKVWASHLAPGLYTPNKNDQFFFLNSDDVVESLKDSLKKLRTTYVELYLAHMPACFSVILL